MGLETVVGSSWVRILQAEFDKEYMRKLAAWVSYTRNSKIIYPESEDVFRAFKLCPFDNVKVVILGKEPYPNGEADGLAFSYKDGIPQGVGKQSLHVIFDEIEEDCYKGFNPNRDYQLDYLAKQGVLLLNAVLTVFRREVGSHTNKGWEQFTTKVIQHLIEEKTPKVFLLWGKDAQAIFLNAVNNSMGHYMKFNTIEQITDRLGNHLILIAYHPAYDLHKRDQFGNVVVRYPEGFTGCKHFSQANTFLLANNIPAIDWFPVEKNVDVPILSNQSPF